MAVVAALRTPPRSFEPSIYLSTPTLFWIGIGVALLVSIVVTFHIRAAPAFHNVGLLLAALSVWSVIALPIIRGYYYYGIGDSLSHLGFAKMFVAGTESPLNLLHPGVHLVSVAISGVTGLSLNYALGIAVIAFFTIFLLFVPLCTWLITGDRAGLTIGVYAALLLLPINLISVHPDPHPSSQAILYAPLILFLLFLYLGQPREDHKPTPLGAVLTIAAASIIFIHPQEALNVIVIFATIAVMGFVFRRVKRDDPISQHRPIYFQTAVLAFLFTLWAPRSPRVISRVEGVYRSLFFTEPTPGEELSQYTVSLAGVGGSIEELFVKLFLPGLVFAILAGALMVASVLGLLDDKFPEKNAFNKYLSVAFVPLLVGTGLVYYAQFGDHYFRYIGFLMMLATILGAAALAKAIPAVSSPINPATLRSIVVVMFVLLLPLAIMSIHPSPWIYNTSSHVTQDMMDGHELAFEHSDEEIAYAGIRAGPRRYVDAIYGERSPRAEQFPGKRSSIPSHVFFAMNITDYYDEPRYVPVTDSNEWREVDLYNQFRYSESGFRSLDTSAGINRVQSSGEFRLYLVVNEQE